MPAVMCYYPTLGDAEDGMSYDSVGLFDLLVRAVEADPHLTLVAISRRLVVHRHTTQRAIRKAGVTWRSLKEKQLMRSVASLRDNPTLSVKEIAAKAGFETPIAFTKRVKRATGASPTSIRKQPTD